MPHEWWRRLVRQGGDALVEGRYRACERLATEAVGLAPADVAPRLLVAYARGEQGRAAEAEVLVRALVAGHPDSTEAQALLGAVLADVGRDAEALRQLDVLPLDREPPPAVLLLAAEAAAALASTDHAETLYQALAGHGGEFAGGHGSVARHLGLLCHVLGRWYEADAHFEVALDVNHAAPAPVLLAHTQRQYAALLRVRGDDGDWERAVDLLDRAATVYRRLDIVRLAEEAEAVLRRSEDATPFDGVNVCQRTAAGPWELAFHGRHATVTDHAGMTQVAALLAADRRPVHVLDLVEPTADVVAEYQARLADLDTDTDPAAAAVRGAERDLLAAELATLEGPVDDGERACRLAALRIRTAIEHVDGTLPALARHLRSSIRTGTCCLYEPDRPERWKMGG